MKFDFFENLSPPEADAFLERFLEVEAAHVDEILRQCSFEDVHVDFSVESIGPFMRWVASKMKTVPTVPDAQLPEWIRSSDTYTNSLFQFDDFSKLLTLRAAYYLGQSFVKSFPILHWGVGNSETAEANMPVVTGFKCELEMSPILITENLLRRVVADPFKHIDFDKAVDYWNQRV